MTDFIIVGAGSAGCVLANRLSADPSARVTLLEAGGSDKGFLYRMPAGFFGLMQSGRGNWNFETVPQPGLDGRTMYFPRGKVLGGCSSINGLVVSRGNPGDYDGWAALGNPGWSFRDCLPYFKRIETYADDGSGVRGNEGPITVSKSAVESMNPISRAWIDACIQAGHPFKNDVNDGNPYGVAQMQGSFADGLRHSAASRYLKPVAGRANLSVITTALVTRIIIEHGRATGVEYLDRGRPTVLRADQEVILAGGVVNSPQLLQLSGIGDPDEIRAHGIAINNELKGVGCNLQDHVSVSVKQRIRAPLSALSTLRPLSMMRTLGQFLLFRSGPGTANPLEAWSHFKSSSAAEYPDMQVYCVCLMYNDHGRAIIREEGFMATINGSRPRSVGTVKIRTSDPTVAPAIDPQYLSNANDLRILREGIRCSRDIIGQAAFDGFRGMEFAPGAAVVSDFDLDRYIRANAATIYHPVGTCKMGSDEMAVVDSRLRVRGIDRLRVVDASVIPKITSGNTNFPVMMIAERAAEWIMNDIGR